MWNTRGMRAIAAQTGTSEFSRWFVQAAMAFAAGGMAHLIGVRPADHLVPGRGQRDHRLPGRHRRPVACHHRQPRTHCPAYGGCRAGQSSASLSTYIRPISSQPDPGCWLVDPVLELRLLHPQ